MIWREGGVISHKFAENCHTTASAERTDSASDRQATLDTYFYAYV